MPEENQTQDGPTKYSSLTNWRICWTKIRCGELKILKTLLKLRQYRLTLNLSLKLLEQQVYTLLLELSVLLLRLFPMISRPISRVGLHLSYHREMIVKQFLAGVERRRF